MKYKDNLEKVHVHAMCFYAKQSKMNTKRIQGYGRDNKVICRCPSDVKVMGNKHIEGTQYKYDHDYAKINARRRMDWSGYFREFLLNKVEV